MYVCIYPIESLNPITSMQWLVLESCANQIVLAVHHIIIIIHHMPLPKSPGSVNLKLFYCVSSLL